MGAEQMAGVSPPAEVAEVLLEEFKSRVAALAEEYGIDDATIEIGDGADESKWSEVEVSKEHLSDLLRVHRGIIGALVRGRVRFVTVLKCDDGEAKFALGLKHGKSILFVRSSEGELRKTFRGGMPLFADEILGRRKPHEEHAAAVERLRSLVGLARKEETPNDRGQKPIRVVARPPKGKALSAGVPTNKDCARDGNSSETREEVCSE